MSACAWMRLCVCVCERGIREFRNYISGGYGGARCVTCRPSSCISFRPFRDDTRAKNFSFFCRESVVVALQCAARSTPLSLSFSLFSSFGSSLFPFVPFSPSRRPSSSLVRRKDVIRLPRRHRATAAPPAWAARVRAPTVQCKISEWRLASFGYTRSLSGAFCNPGKSRLFPSFRRSHR